MKFLALAARVYNAFMGSYSGRDFIQRISDLRRLLDEQTDVISELSVEASEEASEAAWALLDRISEVVEFGTKALAGLPFAHSVVDLSKVPGYHDVIDRLSAARRDFILAAQAETDLGRWNADRSSGAQPT